MNNSNKSNSVTPVDNVHSLAALDLRLKPIENAQEATFDLVEQMIDALDQQVKGSKAEVDTLRSIPSDKVSAFFRTLVETANDKNQDIRQRLAERIKKWNSRIADGQLALPYFPHGGKFIVSSKWSKEPNEKTGKSKSVHQGFDLDKEISVSFYSAGTEQALEREEKIKARLAAKVSKTINKEAGLQEMTPFDVVSDRLSQLTKPELAIVMASCADLLEIPLPKSVKEKTVKSLVQSEE